MVWELFSGPVSLGQTTTTTTVATTATMQAASLTHTRIPHPPRAPRHVERVVDLGRPTLRYALVLRRPGPQQQQERGGPRARCCHQDVGAVTVLVVMVMVVVVVGPAPRGGGTRLELSIVVVCVIVGKGGLTAA
jgi:hypothetical protein